MAVLKKIRAWVGGRAKDSDPTTADTDPSQQDTTGKNAAAQVAGIGGGMAPQNYLPPADEGRPPH